MLDASNVASNLVGFGSKLVTANKHFFALKNGTLLWFEYERARKAQGKIVVADIKHSELNPVTKVLQLLTNDKVYELSPVDDTCKWECDKWYNSIKLIQDMGDVQNLDPNRYMKLNVYTRASGHNVFKDFETLIELYE